MNKKDTILSHKTAKQLHEWGCDVVSDIYFWDTKLENEAIVKRSDPKFNTICYLEEKLYPIYDLRDIICDGEKVKKFFGDKYKELIVHADRYPTLPPPMEILSLLQQNKQKEAEKYLLENCKFNPKNHE